MTAAADALEGDGDGARRTDVADEIDEADVDAKFERGGGDEDFDLAFFEFALGFEAELAGEAAVMGGNIFFAEALAKLMRDALGEAASIDEDEGGAM